MCELQVSAWVLTRDRRMSFHGYFSDFLERFLKIVCFLPSLFCVLSVTQYAIKRYDGEKPICAPRGIHPRDDACEYVNGPELLRTTSLEDTSRLEARVLGLENHCAVDITLNSTCQDGGQVSFNIKIGAQF